LRRLRSLASHDMPSNCNDKLAANYWPSSSFLQSGFGCALMSLRPNPGINSAA
jgi:hypothetical protein